MASKLSRLHRTTSMTPQSPELQLSDCFPRLVHAHPGSSCSRRSAILSGLDEFLRGVHELSVLGQICLHGIPAQCSAQDTELDYSI